jgi:hypothetical protein
LSDLQGILLDTMPAQKNSPLQVAVMSCGERVGGFLRFSVFFQHGFEIGGDENKKGSDHSEPFRHEN